MHVASVVKHVASNAKPATNNFKTKTRLRIEKMIAKVQQRALEDDIIAGRSVTRAQAQENQYTAASREHDDDEGLSTPSPLPTNLPYKQRLVHRWGKG